MVLQIDSAPVSPRPQTWVSRHLLDRIPDAQLHQRRGDSSSCRSDDRAVRLLRSSVMAAVTCTVDAKDRPVYIDLRRLVNGAVVWCDTGLRRERMRAKRPERPALSGQRPPLLARAMRAQVKLAYPVYPVRRADRGPAPITCLIHLVGHSLDGGVCIRVVEGGEHLVRSDGQLERSNPPGSGESDPHRMLPSVSCRPA
jgi:hypothetical protein